tara:strand:+ start:60915 stop:61391 length:477 start_codon:yes stop_codon:yes gene_type:complete
MCIDAYIAMGSNLGDRQAHFARAIELIAQLPETAIECRSTVIETEPVGPGDQGRYLNGVVMISTKLIAKELLSALLEIESSMGRDRDNEVRWGARVIDLDVLVYGDQVIDEPGLSIPHPRLHTRAFVLEPLCELAPDLLIPGQEKTPREMLGVLESTD